MDNKELIQLINKDLALILPEKFSLDELQASLAIYLNELIQKDFDKVVYILYRIDVNEKKLTRILKENSGEEAGKIMAALIIERQLQKITFRKQFNKKDDNISEEDKW